ncbi:hypothetical protein BH10CYA1_BH10CYA1_26320 [soil metagenome]
MNELTNVPAMFNFVETTIQRQRIEPRRDEITILSDGTRVFSNESGQIEYAQYKNGSTLGRFNSYVLVANASDGHWFRDRENQWHRID